MEKNFEARFGNRLKVEDVAALTGAGVSTIYRQYQLYGGIKVGRKLLFFENKLIAALEALYARQEKNIRKDEMVGQDHSAEREEERESLPYEKSCPAMGTRDEGKNVIYLKSRNGLW